MISKNIQLLQPSSMDGPRILPRCLDDLLKIFQLVILIKIIKFTNTYD